MGLGNGYEEELPVFGVLPLRMRGWLSLSIGLCVSVIEEEGSKALTRNRNRRRMVWGCRGTWVVGLIWIGVGFRRSRHDAGNGQTLTLLSNYRERAP